MLTIRNTSSSDNPLENEDFLAELLQVGFHAMVAVAVLGFGAVSGHDRSACLVFFDTGNRVCSRLATPDRGMGTSCWRSQQLQALGIPIRIRPMKVMRRL